MPALTVRPPLKILAPESVRVPAPVLVIVVDEPEMLPATVRLPATFHVWLSVNRSPRPDAKVTPPPLPTARPPEPTPTVEPEPVENE